MKLTKAFATIALAAGVVSSSVPAYADAPADDFINPQDPGARLSFLMLFAGFRTNYDHRFQVEKDISEVRTQLIGDVLVPYGELSANVDARFFLMMFGASVGYHDEWHVLQFTPNYGDDAGVHQAKDLGGQQLSEIPENRKSFGELDRDARRVKDQNADVQTDTWKWGEGRVGFVWPGQGFLWTSTAALRYEGRPDVSYDWANATVMNGGMHLRWETLSFVRHRNIGFIGPAVKVMNVPRNRLTENFGAAQKDDMCLQSDDVPCEEQREWEVQYGFLGGLRPNWIAGADLLLLRIYTTYGLDNALFGTHLFGAPLSILMGYQLDVEF